MMMEWVPYLALPFIAAVIGYFTNWVAIWMLFRPHHEVRILGLKLPLTPGVIPGRRLEMAERMGSAIAEHLINESSIQERLDTPQMREQIENALMRYCQELLTRDWASINSLVPDRWNTEWNKLVSSLKRQLHCQIVELAQRETTEELIAEHVSHQLSDWMSQPISVLAPESLIESVPSKAGAVYDSVVHSDEFAADIESFLEAQSTELVRVDQPIGKYVPESFRAYLYEQTSVFMPIFRERLLALVQEENFKKRAKVEIYELVDRVLSETFKENSRWDQFKFGLMETFFISVDEIKEKIDTGIEEAIPKIEAFLETPEAQARIESAIGGVLDSLLAKRISELSTDHESLASLRQSATEVVLRALRTEKSRERFGQLVERKLNEHRDASLDAILGEYVSQQELEPLITTQIVDYLRSESTHEKLMELISHEIDKFLNKPIGVLENRIEPDVVDDAISWLTEQSIVVLKRETPRILSAVDVEGLVREQVNRLPLDEVERLILAITSRQLRAITWFGALLGFSIGLVQLVVLAITGGIGT